MDFLQIGEGQTCFFFFFAAMVGSLLGKEKKTIVHVTSFKVDSFYWLVNMQRIWKI